MAQFDVYRLGRGLVIDCQSNLLAHLNTALVVPLIPRNAAPKPASRFNPMFVVEGVDHIMDTQFASTVERRHLGVVVTTLADQSFAIVDAFDVLLGGV